jgi:hypothetical protein
MESFKTLVKTISFKKASKKKIQYKFKPSIDELVKNSYTVCKEDNKVIITQLQSDKQIETKNTANKGDIVIKGPFGEVYTMNFTKFIALYNVNNGNATPVQSHRYVAEVTKKQLKCTITFKSPWNEDMLLIPGDYLVKDGKGFYRIERNAFKKTYVFV